MQSLSPHRTETQTLQKEEHREKNTAMALWAPHNSLHTHNSILLAAQFFFTFLRSTQGSSLCGATTVPAHLLLPSSFYTPPSAFLLLSLLLLPFLPKVKFRATYCFAVAFWTLKWSASDQTHSQHCEQASKTQTSKSQTTRKRSCFPNRSSLRADSGWLHRIRVGPAHICKILFIISRNCFEKQQLFL